MSGDIVERLRSQHSDLRQGALYSKQEDPAWDATTDAADLLDAIDALHQPVGYDEVYGFDCAGCGQAWPCRTHRLLHPEGGPS